MIASRKITLPLDRLVAAADKMSTGDYAVRVDLSPGDELGRLGTAFNAMAGHVQESHRRLEVKVQELRVAQDQLLQTERMDACGKLAGGVAHDFNNLLSVIIGETDLALLDRDVDPRLRESFASIRKAGEHAAVLTQQLLAFSKRQLVQPTVFNLNDVLMDESKVLRPLIPEGIELLTRTSAADAWVFADRTQIAQVIRNLVVNARDAMSKRGKLIVATSNVTLEASCTYNGREMLPGAYILLTVSDTGAGMSDEMKAHVFEPFFTTKALGEGTNLGLATCFEIVTQSGGHIAVDGEAVVGTAFNVFLPQVPAATHRIETDTTKPPRGTEIILLTEDDDSVRQVAARILQGQGYCVLQAASAGDALRILTASDVKLDLLLTDVVLPRMGGRELAERAQKARPGIRVLFVSGYTNDVILQHRLIAHQVALVQKPFTAESLGRKVREVLDAPARSPF
jgi:two-component system cell cycle sensor histidine kinase/response regulator CckA